MQEMLVQSLGWKDPLHEEMATHSSILAWKIPWTEVPGGAAVHGVSKGLDTTEHMYLLSPSLFPSLDGVTAQEMSEDERESVGQELLFWGLPW